MRNLKNVLRLVIRIIAYALGIPVALLLLAPQMAYNVVVVPIFLLVLLVEWAFKGRVETYNWDLLIEMSTIMVAPFVNLYFKKRIGIMKDW